MTKYVITNKDVDYTFDNQPCKLRRSITEVCKINGEKFIKILTERVTFVEETVIVEEYPPIFDHETGEVTYKEPKTEQRIFLKVLSQKDEVRTRILTKAEVDAVYNMVKSQVLFGESFYDFEDNLETASLIALTKLDKPYNTLPSDWEIYSETPQEDNQPNYNEMEFG
ncbi:hypothetical protein HYO65_gp007 [Tenacibaculum phage PTm1]|uniref:Uncharacterized protein n=2 Tax=Shirahamavirus PTm1 TaxID=2846435 RepID=A0A5S9ERQ4_9CAUD|nr:hypothetical protein HYO65_gp007 [Tenacibaculum phage PTm1]BBI90399.1 hypothetical protein [Tenacibaculum phage PTm1]BBI90706.1 hypothetical protein [Tenacibaculum phage PTm5]